MQAQGPKFNPQKVQKKARSGNTCLLFIPALEGLSEEATYLTSRVVSKSVMKHYLKNAREENHVLTNKQTNEQKLYQVCGIQTMILKTD